MEGQSLRVLLDVPGAAGRRCGRRSTAARRATCSPIRPTGSSSTSGAGTTRASASSGPARERPCRAASTGSSPAPGFPAYLSDVLTGTATYNAVAQHRAHQPVRRPGTLTGARLDVNFTNRTLNATIGVTMPVERQRTRAAAGSSRPRTCRSPSARSSPRPPTACGSPTAPARTRIRTPSLYGSFEGSFVGRGARRARWWATASPTDVDEPSNRNTVNGVIGFQGPPQNAAAEYRDGLVSDPDGRALLGARDRNFTTSNRPDEVTANAQGGGQRLRGALSGRRAPVLRPRHRLGGAVRHGPGNGPRVGPLVRRRGDRDRGRNAAVALPRARQPSLRLLGRAERPRLAARSRAPRPTT